MSTYTTTVGIEVHAELRTKSKMFCGCANDPHAAAPNTLVCPVCMAHPGTLPVVNQEAVRLVRLVGAAIGADLATFSEFDRKNYFYPDIPKAYQISQYQHPLVTGGELAGVAINRIHLEEDTARSQHDQGSGSLVDYNRAGVPLMELVTEPVIHTPEDAAAFARELQLLLKMLGVSGAQMERGEMRVEANISVSADPDKLAEAYVEVKNLNSFKAMEAAIVYESKRQIAAYEAGEIVVKETRGWDETKAKTFSQRTKESANDYRYFPDPDITKYSFTTVTGMSVSRLNEILPELPQEIRIKYSNLGLPSNQIETILANETLLNFLQEVIDVDTAADPKLIKLAANYLASDVVSLLQENPEQSLHKGAARQYVSLMGLVSKGEINSRTAKDLLPEVLFSVANPSELAAERGLTQQNNADTLLPLVEQVIASNASVVAEFKAGKEASLKFLVGQGMKLSKGTANPQLLEELLRSKITG